VRSVTPGVMLETRCVWFVNPGVLLETRCEVCDSRCDVGDSCVRFVTPGVMLETRV